MYEKEIIESFLRTRSEELYGELFAVLYPRVRRYFILKGLDNAVAEDLAQESLLKVFQRAGELREQSLFLGWVFAIARNELLLYWRRLQSRIATVSFETSPEILGVPAPEGEGGIGSTLLPELISCLEPAERDLLLLRFVEELSYEELAQVLEIPIGTVKWRLYRLKRKLSSAIKRDISYRRRTRIH